MSNSVLLECTDLYNMLQQSDKYPCLSDPNYLLLIDARERHEFFESHVVTARKAPRSADSSYKVPYDSELECKNHVVVYDGNTATLDDSDTPAFRLARYLMEQGSRNPVKIVKGGYEDFSAQSPFLRTKDVLYMPLDLDVIKTWPVELISGSNGLYMGATEHAFDKAVNKDIKIRGHVNCSLSTEIFFKDTQQVFSVPVEDCGEKDIKQYFRAACDFIDSYRNNDKCVLIYSDLGISRSATVAMAYLIYNQQMTLEQAWNHLLRCKHNMRPSRGFVKQLSQWEEDIHGEKKTDISEPRF